MKESLSRKCVYFVRLMSREEVNVELRERRSDKLSEAIPDE